MKKLLLFNLCVSFFLLFTISGKSQQFAGADMTYKCVGGNDYLITYTLYHDCSSSNPPSSLQLVIECSSNASFNFNTTLNLVSGSKKEITPACALVPSKCNNGTNYGIEEYTYQKQVTLPPCNSWKISSLLCCRVPVSTVPSASSYSGYIYSILNNGQAPSNNSPEFESEPTFVVAKGQNILIDAGASDTDGDSLVYSFYAPLTSTTGVLSYTNPYTYTNFLLSNTPIIIDSETGKISCSPFYSLITIVGIKVMEYRTINNIPTLIGTIVRDVQIRVLTNTDSVPILGGMNFSNNHSYNPNDSIYYSELHYNTNKVVEFNIAGFDADTFNSVNIGSPEKFKISWDNGIPAATLDTFYNNSDSAYAHFSWTLFASDISNTPKCFYVKIQDFSCPYYLINYKKYCIKVLPDNTGINESSKNLLSLSQNYPNPAKDYTLIDVELAKESNTSIQITDICGRKILEKDFGKLPNGKSTLEILLEGIAPGLYFYTLVIGNERVSRKMVVE